MTEKNDSPTVISVEEIAKQTANILAEKMKPAQKADSLNENSEPEQFNYKEKVAAMIKDVNSNWKWTGDDVARDRKMFEAIGAASLGSAVPEIWARDVFRCCPYPASAFWDAPFIKPSGLVQRRN